jgi:hypothetical protein
MKDRAATDAIDRNAIDEVRLSVDLPSAHGAREKAERIRLYPGVAKPTNVNPDATGFVHWQKCYGKLWELKLSFEKEHNR